MFLNVEKINTFYGTSHILFGVSLNVKEGKSIGLLGRNGAGKTTLLRSIMGLTPPKSGRIVFLNKEIRRMPVYSISRMGIGYVPEDRMIFPDLTVWENLTLGIHPRRKAKFTIEMAYQLFPVLEKMKDRLGGMTSGGEQQMLSIARTLMTNPTLLLLDEPLEGLSPLVVQELVASIKYLKENQGITIFLCEQNVRVAMDLCSWIYVIEKGTIHFQGSMEELRKNEEVQERYLTVHGKGRRRPRTSR